MTALPAGNGLARTRLWDSQWRLIWDSATAKTPAYQHINTWVNATIDHRGQRRPYRFYRTPNGIERSGYEPEHLKHFLEWPKFDAISPGECQETAGDIEEKL